MRVVETDNAVARAGNFRAALASRPAFKPLVANTGPVGRIAMRVVETDNAVAEGQRNFPASDPFCPIFITFIANTLAVSFVAECIRITRYTNA